MDVSSSVFQLQENCEFLLEPSLSTTDAGYYSACSSLSPASSTDSNCFSPPTFHHGPGYENFSEIFSGSFDLNCRINPEVEAPKRTGRPRSKFPGVKRQNASEREKLRMRDLTKALQHLRTYLPPSVAPAGQTLTKIETLRLTIRYISQLSAQLEPAGPASDSFNVQASQDDPQISIFSGQEFFSMPSMPSTPNKLYYQGSDPNSSVPVSVPPSSPAQDYWFTQQQYCHYGRC